MVAFEFPVRFENPVYGLAGIVIGVIAVFLFSFSYRRLRKAQKKLELVEWRRLRRVVRGFNVSTKVGVVIALSFLLARPYLPTTIEVPVSEATEEQMAQYTITTLVLMDVSYSMNYSDLNPTRLEVSKTMSKLLISKMDAKDLVGVISFAGQVYDVVRPTTNRTRVAEVIDDQTVHNSTALGVALTSAIGALANQPGGKAIVLFSDGKNNIGEFDSAVDQAAALKIAVFTVSVGTYGMGEADPLALKDISERTEGKFYEVRNEEIERLAESVGQISHEVKTGALKGVYDKLILPVDDYEVPTLIFSVLLVAALFLMWFTGV